MTSIYIQTVVILVKLYHIHYFSVKQQCKISYLLRKNTVSTGAASHACVRHASSDGGGVRLDLVVTEQE